ncbi:MAG: Hydroxyacylglutathione hydrolase [Pseudomonadota bacterium]|jgi:glyoxylase-like metal-dependent hydrolase (beta-lactamase superfamily II)
MQDALNIPGLQVFERGWLSANNILLRDAQSCTLVDSGYVTHQDQTLMLLQNALGEQPLDRLVNTHLHSDHCGGNALLQSVYPNLATLIPAGDSEAVASWNVEDLSYEATGQQCPRFTFSNVLRTGQTLTMANLEWQVLSAPGHDPHSVILFEPTHRILISADALWANGFGVVFPELEGIAAFDEVSQTLDLIESLGAQWVIPGHGSVFSGVEAALVNARHKLNGFVQNPAKHAKYGAKVLLKYKLLELHKTQLSQFVAWATQVRYFKVLHQTYKPEISIQDWVLDMLKDLERSSALELQGEWVLNV